MMYGSVTVAVRGMTATESANHAADVADGRRSRCSTTFLLLFGFRMADAADAAMLVCSGVANAIAQYLWTRALHLAPATAVSPFYYLHAGLGAGDRLRGLGRRADRRAAGRLGDRRRVRAVPALARGQAQPQPPCPSRCPLAAQAANVLSAAHAVMISPSFSAGTGALNR